jgi:hypothetical protein
MHGQCTKNGLLIAMVPISPELREAQAGFAILGKIDYR